MGTGKKILTFAAIAGAAAGTYALYKKGRKITEAEEAEAALKAAEEIDGEQPDPELERLFEEADEAMAGEEGIRTEFMDLIDEAKDKACEIGRNIAVGFGATVDEVKEAARKTLRNLQDETGDDDTGADFGDDDDFEDD